jgi:hypothetical protein
MSFSESCLSQVAEAPVIRTHGPLPRGTYSETHRNLTPSPCTYYPEDSRLSLGLPSFPFSVESVLMDDM